jgi:hypothetical protein
MGLFNSTVLDVIIGLIFVYLLLAILCTAANEWASAITRRRAKMLKKGIAQLLGKQPLPGDGDSDAFRRRFYKHPLIKSMMHDEHHPAYISPRTFTTVVTDIVKLKPGQPSLQSIVDGTSSLPDGDVKQSLTALIEHADAKVEDIQTAMEGWFNDAMDRVTGWYKRRTQLWTIGIALALTIVSNADTVQISRRLWADPVLRTKVIEEAKVRSQKPPPTISVEYEDDQDPTQPSVVRTDGEGNKVTAGERELLGQLIGWGGTDVENNPKAWLERLLGWLLTVLALSMGAPFWFDLLNKFMNVRYTGKSPDEKPKKPEKAEAAPVRA